MKIPIFDKNKTVECLSNGGQSKTSKLTDNLNTKWGDEGGREDFLQEGDVLQLKWKKIGE